MLKIYKLLFLIYFSLCLLGAFAQPGRWHYIAPNRFYFGGNGFASDITFIDTTTGYAANKNNPEILKTTNGGQTWQSKVCNVSNAFKLQFESANTGWIANASQLSKTTDGGDSWVTLLDTTLIPSPNASILSFHFIDVNTGFLSGSNCLMKTVDGGATWIDVRPQVVINPWPGPNDTWHYVHFVNALDGWAFGKNGYAYRTTDGGNNWIASLISFPDNTDFVKAGRFYSSLSGVIITRAGVVFNTFDGGATWVFKSSISPATNMYIAKFANDSMVYCNDSDGDALLSLDTGTTWQPLVNAQVHYGLHFFSPTHGFFNSFKEIYKTTDGVSFDADIQDYPIVYNYPIRSFDQLSANKLTVTNVMQDAMESTNNGIDWVGSNANEGVISIKSTAANCYYKQTSDNVLRRYKNGVQTFALQQHFLAYATGLDSIIVYTRPTGDSIAILSSINGGVSWTTVSTLATVGVTYGQWPAFYTGTSDLFWLARFSDWNNGVIAYFDNQGFSREHVTTNHGTNWKNFPPNNSDSVIYATKISPTGKLYCLRGNLKVVKLLVYNESAEAWDLVNTLNWGCSNYEYDFADFDWSPDGVLWLNSCVNGRSNLVYSLDEGYTLNDSKFSYYKVSHFRKTYSGRFLAGTSSGHLLEYNAGENNGKIKGSVYYDFNRNNVMDGYDTYAQMHIVHNHTNTVNAITSDSGAYTLLTTIDTFNISPQSVPNYISVPPSRTLIPTSANPLLSGNDFILQPVDTSVRDLQIGIVPGIQTNPGFTHHVFLFCSNNGIVTQSQMLCTCLTHA